VTTPRKHHYVPQCYLSGFTIEPASTRLYVLDKESGRSYPSRIGDAGCERDFYIIELEDDGDPFAIEKFFSTIEAGGAEAIRHLIERRAVPEGDLYGKFVNFLAVMTVRGPAVLDAIEKPFAHAMKSILYQVTGSREMFDRMMEKLKAEGKDVSGVTYESMRAFVRSDDCVVTMGQNFRMSSLLEMLKTVGPLLAARKWTVVAAADGVPDFICSDRPVTLSWNRAELLHPFYSPGLGLKDTTVMFPVSRRLALMGLFDVSSPLRELDARGVGLINMFTAMNAKRFVYSGADDFTVSMGEDRPLTGRQGFVDAIKTAAEA
jgi:hypothetical protein